MSNGASQDLDWERYRQYLHLIARLELDARFEGKLDLSGVVQQTLLEAHQQHSLRGPTEAARRAWLRRILAHNLIDEVRRLGAQVRDVSREYSLEAALDESSAHVEKWLAADDTSPSATLEREEQLYRMTAVLALLPADQRVAIELHHLRGLALAVVAQRMGRTRSAVASLIFRGLRTMRKALEDEPSGDRSA